MRRLLSVLTVFTVAVLAQAAGTTPEELALRDEWVKSCLDSATATKPAPGLHVVANHDAVCRNTRGGKPLNIGGHAYERGLYCHAVSKVVVYLPSPGKSLSAVVGVDSNEQTRPGRGSVIFSVDVSGREAFRSDVLHEGAAGVPVDVDLKQATTFTLEVGDAGDGISCDQSDWADAKVQLQDGGEVWLGDLPFVEPPTGLPFSFTYGGRPSAQLLADWPRKEEVREIDADRTGRTISWTDPVTGLETRFQAVSYRDFSTIEWTVYFRNTSQEPTPILSDVMSMDLSLAPGKGQPFTLHHNAGSQANSDDYRPLTTPLLPGQSLRLASSGGRGSDGTWPYFNVETGGGQGVALAVGWPGQWAATFSRPAAEKSSDKPSPLRFRAGQELTHFKLLPGEEVRGPLAVVQFYRGDWLAGQNLWRRWMVAHNVPRMADGKLPKPLLAASSGGQFDEMQHANEANQKQFIDAYLDHGVPLSFWWMDAGWYPFQKGWWNVGTWEPDPVRFPAGLRAVSDHAHARNINVLVWFEPERVAVDTWLAKNHPEWLLGEDGHDKLLDLGNADARRWLIDHVDTLMTEQGIDIYRQDFNFPPLDIWRKNDAPDRQGITEIRHVSGYLAYWDELRRRRPGLLIDTCASGGRRNDLETLRRSVPLHKSDMAYDNLTAKQTQFYGLALWEPYFGAPVFPSDRVDVYGFRCGMSLLSGFGYDVRRNDLDYDLLHKLLAQRDQVIDYLWADYYPLTSWSFEPDVWMAWQFNRPETGSGIVQAFRRPQSPYETARLKLRDLDGAATYTIHNFDADGQQRATGQDLMEKGLLITLPQQPGAAIFVYERAKN